MLNCDYCRTARVLGCETYDQNGMAKVPVFAEPPRHMRYCPFKAKQLRTADIHGRRCGMRLRNDAPCVGQPQLLFYRATVYTTFDCYLDCPVLWMPAPVPGDLPGELATDTSRSWKKVQRTKNSGMFKADYSSCAARAMLVGEPESNSIRQAVRRLARTEGEAGM